MALPPSASASAATCRASAALDRELTTTLAPRAANSSTIALPRLRPEPVTSRVFPAIPNSSVMMRDASFLGAVTGCCSLVVWVAWVPPLVAVVDVVVAALVAGARRRSGSGSGSRSGSGWIGKWHATRCPGPAP